MTTSLISRWCALRLMLTCDSRFHPGPRTVAVKEVKFASHFPMHFVPQNYLWGPVGSIQPSSPSVYSFNLRLTHILFLFHLMRTQEPSEGPDLPSTETTPAEECGCQEIMIRIPGCQENAEGVMNVGLSITNILLFDGKGEFKLYFCSKGLEQQVSVAHIDICLSNPRPSSALWLTPAFFTYN